MPAHLMVLVWLLVLAPLAYLLRRRALTNLLGASILVWALLFTFRAATFGAFLDRAALLPAVLGASGVLLFAFGGLHYPIARFAELARGLRLFGLFATILAFLALCTPGLSERSFNRSGFEGLGLSVEIMLSFAVLLALGAGLTVLNMLLIPVTPKLTRAEGPVSLGLLLLLTIYVFVPLPGRFLMGLLSLGLLAAALIVLGVAYVRKDRRLAGVAAVGLTALFLIRFTVWFWAA